ncbi:MAG: DUF1566 domain-containing protein [Treponema sp.]|jgi:TolB-like protein|nr:DUF1566 domain-containing protein [Treponema sp.]
MKRFLMRKPAALFVLGILCVWTVSAQTAVELDSAVQQAGKEISAKLYSSTTIALLSCAAPTDAMSAYVLKEMASTLEKITKMVVILSRNDVDRALAESKAKSTDNITDASALQIGKKLTAQYLVTGVMEKNGETYRLRTRLISVPANKMEVSTTANIKDSALVRQLIPPAAVAAPVAPSATPAPAPAPATAPAPKPAQAPAVSSGVYKIGDTGPAGGIIFYDKGNNTNGWRYLEAAPLEGEFLVVWSVRDTFVENTQQSIGNGSRNSVLIVEQFKQTSGEWDTAAQKADDLTLNGYNDWFLPSRAELDQMYGNLKRKNLGEYKNEWYWSSSDSSKYYAQAQNFRDGSISTAGKGNKYYVRPIRHVPGA